MSRKRSILVKSRNLPELGRTDELLQDLYVFGYQSAIFRDDEKAQFIEEGRHLIPWMGDETNMIDRYDGRGHLHDLSEYDADLTRGRFESLTSEERSIEALCDEERYLELHTDVMEKMLYEEEELKRLNEALADSSYAAVGFDYANPGGVRDAQYGAEQYAEPAEDDETAPFVPSPALLLPPAMVTPTTVRAAAIMERTALFISQHGAQMEIMMKAKQKDNAQFHFLTYEDELNPFYRHLVSVIKTHKYVPAAAAAATAAAAAAASSKADEPAEPVEEPEPESTHISSEDFLESIQSKLPAGQIANTSYATLLNNLRRQNAKIAVPDPIVTSPSPDPVRPLPKSLIVCERGQRGPGDKRARQRRGSKNLNGTSGGLGMGEAHGSNEKSKSVDEGASERGKDKTYRRGEGDRSGRGGREDSGGSSPEYSEERRKRTKSSRKHSQPHAQQPDSSQTVTSVLPPPTIPPPLLLGAPPLQVAAPPLPPVIIPPSPDMQPIIDKMADYVVRNGPEFETVVRLRNDARFSFISEGHVHHTYYLYKKNIYIKEMEAQKLKKEQEAREQERPEQKRKRKELAAAAAAAAETEEVAEPVIGPMRPAPKVPGVSFSIKSKEEELSSRMTKGVNLYESSDSDGENEGGSGGSGGEGVREARPTQSRAVGGGREGSGGWAPPMEQRPVPTSIVQSDRPSVPLPLGIGPEDKKQVESRLADRLASAAREKHAQAARSRQVQLQRQRKAALFASMLKHSALLQGDDNTCDAAATAGEVSAAASADRSRSATPTSILLSSRVSVASPAFSEQSQPAVGSSRVGSPRACASGVGSPAGSVAGSQGGRLEPSLSPVPESVKLPGSSVHDDLQVICDVSPRVSRHHHSKKKSKKASKSSHKRARSRSRSRSPRKHKKRKKTLPSSYSDSARRSPSPSLDHNPSHARPSRPKQPFVIGLASQAPRPLELKAKPHLKLEGSSAWGKAHRAARVAAAVSPPRHKHREKVSSPRHKHREETSTEREARHRKKHKRKARRAEAAWSDDSSSSESETPSPRKRTKIVKSSSKKLSEVKTTSCSPISIDDSDSDDDLEVIGVE